MNRTYLKDLGAIILSVLLGLIFGFSAIQSVISMVKIGWRQSSVLAPSALFLAVAISCVCFYTAIMLAIALYWEELQGNEKKR